MIRVPHSLVKSERLTTLFVGALAASAVWIAALALTSTTPEEARRERAEPVLGPPTVALIETALRQISWHDCTSTSSTTEIRAPKVPSGIRPVVTSIAGTGSQVETGTVMARVADEPLVAVVDGGILYRDLVPGATGTDVATFERALARAGIIARADGVMDVGTIFAWNERVDPSQGQGRIPISTLVSIPASSIVGAHRAGVGELAPPGSPLVTVRQSHTYFVCGGVSQDIPLKPEDLILRADGRRLHVSQLVLHERASDQLASVQVWPARNQLKAETARLGIEYAATEGRVFAAPLSAVKVTEQGTTAVVVVTGTSLKEVPVDLGVTAQGLVELNGRGLKEGDQLELFDPGFGSARGGQGLPAASPGPG